MHIIYERKGVCFIERRRKRVLKTDGRRNVYRDYKKDIGLIQYCSRSQLCLRAWSQNEGSIW